MSSEHFSDTAERVLLRDCEPVLLTPKDLRSLQCLSDTVGTW